MCLFSFSNFNLSPMPMPEALLREASSYVPSCIGNTLCRSGISSCFKFSQFGWPSETKLLFAAFMAGFGNNGIICAPVCFWIFDVNKLFIQNRAVPTSQALDLLSHVLDQDISRFPSFIQLDFSYACVVKRQHMDVVAQWSRFTQALEWQHLCWRYAAV